MNYSLDELVARLNAWCQAHHIHPANGQAADTMSVRTLRYYRTAGLMDAPSSGKGQGYGERHFLQAASVRLLQAQGLPLNRIHSLLFGRSEEELRKVVEEGSAHDLPSPPRAETTFPIAEAWTMHPLNEDWMLISRRAAQLPPETLSQVRALLAGAPATFHSNLHAIQP